MSETPGTPNAFSPLQNLGRYIVPPDLRALLTGLKGEIAAELNCHQLGTIAAITGTTAQVQLSFQRVVYNNPPDGSAIAKQPAIVPYPVLVDVPVFCLTGGNAYITMPVSVGDPCLVLFNDRDFDQWFVYGADPAPPNSLRMHSLADGLALVGFRPLKSPLSNVPSDGEHIGIGNTSGTLREALDALFTALIGAVISGTSFNPATITAITAAKTAVDAILQ